MKKLIAIVALLLAMVMLLSACGNDEEGSSSSSSSSSNNTKTTSSSNSIEGTWKLTGIKSASASAEEIAQSVEMINKGAMSMELTFKDGKLTGVMTYDLSKMGMEGATPETSTNTTTYKTEGNKLITTPEGSEQPESVEFKVNGNTLELQNTEGQDTYLVFTRK